MAGNEGLGSDRVVFVAGSLWAHGVVDELHKLVSSVVARHDGEVGGDGTHETEAP